MNTMLICGMHIVGRAMEQAVSCKILITETWVWSQTLHSCIGGAESAIVG